MFSENAAYPPALAFSTSCLVIILLPPLSSTRRTVWARTPRAQAAGSGRESLQSPGLLHAVYPSNESLPNRRTLGGVDGINRHDLLVLRPDVGALVLLDVRAENIKHRCGEA